MNRLVSPAGLPGKESGGLEVAKLDSSREIRAQIEMHEFLLVHLFAQLVEHLPFGEDMLGNVVVNADVSKVPVVMPSPRFPQSPAPGSRGWGG